MKTFKQSKGMGYLLLGLALLASFEFGWRAKPAEVRTITKTVPVYNFTQDRGAIDIYANTFGLKLVDKDAKVISSDEKIKKDFLKNDMKAMNEFLKVYGLKLVEKKLVFYDPGKSKIVDKDARVIGKLDRVINSLDYERALMGQLRDGYKIGYRDCMKDYNLAQIRNRAADKEEAKGGQ